jgi:hypothetical protein
MGFVHAGAAGSDPERGRGGGDRARPAGGGGLPRRDGAVAQLQQRQLHGLGQDPKEVRQAHGGPAPAPRHRAHPAAAFLHHRPHLQARQGLRGHDGGRLPSRRPAAVAQGPGGFRRRRAEHLPQHHRRAAHHAGGPKRQLHRRPLLAAAHAAAAGVRLAAPVDPAAVAVDPHTVTRPPHDTPTSTHQAMPCFAYYN